MQRDRRRRLYFVMMGTCVVLIVLAWNVVRLWSVPAAVVMSVVAAVLPPAASVIGNVGALDDSQLPSGERARARAERRPRIPPREPDDRESR